MERLTLEDAINRSRKLAERHRWNSENTKLETSNENANEVYKNTCIQYADQEEQYAKWLEELKSYKEAEEQGLLVRLPFKLNDKLYHFYEIDFEDDFADAAPDEIIAEVIATEFIIDRHEITIKCITGWNSPYDYLPVAEIGKTVFLTREEAEKKLEEIKNG